MGETGDNKEKKPLNTILMHEKLKGESFPENWEGFIDDDIRNFFDALFNETKQKKSERIRKANLSRVYGYSLWRAEDVESGTLFLIALAMSLT